MNHDGIERMLPLYEAKMIHHYDHRWATYEADGSTREVTMGEKQDSGFTSLPRYWVYESIVRDRLEGRWARDGLLGWRRIARSTDERTMISAIIPEAAFGDSIFLMLPASEPLLGPALQAILSSFVLDFTARQKIGGTNASFFLIEQLPVLALEALRRPTPWHVEVSLGTWLGSRSEAAATDFRHTRALRRAELDAAMFQMYGVDRDDVDHIMETFPIVKRKDEETYGEYRTKQLILRIFDEIAAAIASGTQYASAFDEPRSQQEIDDAST